MEATRREDSSREAAEEAIVEELVRNHKEKAKEAAAEMAATRKAAAEKASNNMERHGEIKRRFKAVEALDDGDEEEWGAQHRASELWGECLYV